MEMPSWKLDSFSLPLSCDRVSLRRYWTNLGMICDLRNGWKNWTARLRVREHLSTLGSTTRAVSKSLNSTILTFTWAHIGAWACVRTIRRNEGTSEIVSRRDGGAQSERYKWFVEYGDWSERGLKKWKIKVTDMCLSPHRTDTHSPTFILTQIA